MIAAILQFVSLVVFASGAPAFAVLAVSFWREKRTASALFQLFTIVCALAFLTNLLSALSLMPPFLFPWVKEILAALIPPMMAHLIVEREFGDPRWKGWNVILLLLYLASLATGIGGNIPWIQQWYIPSPYQLCFVSFFCVGILFRGRCASFLAKRQRLWNVILFCLLFFTGLGALIYENPIFELAPDYLVLLFFAGHLYYTERLAFFDTFLRFGSYFAVGAGLFALVLLEVPPFSSYFLNDWRHSCLGILTLLPIWLLGPLVFRNFSRWTNLALGRRYSASRAEHYFLQCLQTLSREEELREATRQALQEIFNCSAEVAFSGQQSCQRATELSCPLSCGGYLLLRERTSQIPYLGDDQRLLQSLSQTLEVLLQNVRLRLAQQEQLQREQELAAMATRAELRALRAQIDPHFLFNALNAIAGWIRTEPELADDTVAQLAEVFRYTLHRSQYEWVRMEEEVEFLRAYLAVERARFGDRLEVVIDVSPNAGDVLIPAMLIQPLVENAVKHGFSSSGKNGRIALKITMVEKHIQIEVTDSGPGFPQGFNLEQTSGHGLRSVADRLKGYYGEAGVLRTESSINGCRVVIELEIQE